MFRLCLLLAWGAPQIACAQDIFSPDSIKKKITAPRAVQAISIDGRLTEADWAQATLVSDFTQADPHQGQPARRQTQVRLLHDDQYLYIAAVCYDTVGARNYRVLNLQRDYRASQQDFFAFAIDGYNDERNCAMFMLNPFGAQRDLLSFDDNYYEPDWDGLWKGRTHRTDTAWIAEMAVPWKTLRYKTNHDALQTWGISFARLTRSINEVSYFPAFPRAYGGLRMPYAAKLINLPAPKPSFNLRIQPYLLVAANSYHQNHERLTYSHTVKSGGEVKWAINPNALLDLTFNTDFAQADVDRKVNNLNRFSVFFPERRQFFLENSGVFTAGIEPLANDFSEFSTRIQPFFSRAIGLDAAGAPLPITAGGRFVYRSGKQNVGAMVVRQQGNATTSPATVGVARYSQNIGKQNRLGVLMSWWRDDVDTIRTQQTYTIDGFMRITQSLSLRYMMSTTTAAARRAAGVAGAWQLSYTTNTWSAWWNQSRVDQHYNPAMGFVARSGVWVSEGGASRQFRGRWLPQPIRAVTPGASLTLYHQVATGKWSDRYLNLTPLSILFQQGGGVSWTWYFFEQQLSDNFTPLNTVIRPGVYRYHRHRVTFRTDPSRKVSWTAGINGGQYYNGKYHALNASLVVALIPQVYVAGTAEAGKTMQLGEQRTSQNVRLYSVESRLALNPRLQLTGLFQQSSLSNSMGWNIRFAWEYKPLSYVYVVFNNNIRQTETWTSDRALIAKISYLKQF